MCSFSRELGVRADPTDREGEMRADYERYVNSLGISARVHFLGRRDDMQSILGSVDMLVHPSRVDATPYVIIEALAAGLPVVASNVYGIPELVQDGVSGILVPEGDASALAGSVAKLAENPELRKRIAVAARQRYEARFTIEESVKKTMTVYDELFA